MITHLSGPRMKATIIVVISRQHIRTGRVQVPQASCFVKNPLILSGTELVVEPQKIKNYVCKSGSRTRTDSSGSSLWLGCTRAFIRYSTWKQFSVVWTGKVEIEGGKLFAALDSTSIQIKLFGHSSTTFPESLLLASCLSPLSLPFLASSIVDNTITNAISTCAHPVNNQLPLVQKFRSSGDWLSDINVNDNSENW